ncbi:FtsX-like permease family protein [Umezawaea tangerina]|uniref:Putative ABC transport system permease protein n=1 Tax=Umezawaea tangerina TaxID=84725 RepID=A0A2T0SXK2_9PSEU|nr:ABC transporter permease [Umezawaea tangerina]PRY38147.1 putative ABC transport system permease protein [Umezawaea tangerina]
MPTTIGLALAEFRHRPGRALLPGVALIVGVACLIASLVLSDALVKAADEGMPVVPSAVTLQVGLDQDPMLDLPVRPVLDQAAADRIAAVPGVERVVPVRRIGVDLLLDNGRAGTRRGVGDVEVDREGLRRVPIGEGRSPASDGEIAVDRVTADQYHLAPGATVKVADAQGKPLDVVVRGITKRGSTGDQPAVVVGEALAAKLDPKPEVSELHVVGGEQAAVAAAAGPGLLVSGVSESARSGLGGSNGEALSTVLIMFAILALATASFVAAATFRAVYLQRQRQTALLRCLGATRKPLVLANLLEALLTGAVAGALGALVGGPVALGLSRIFDVTGVSAMFGTSSLTPELLPSTGYAVVGAVVAALLSAFAAVRPSLAATRVSPLAALRTSEGATPSSSVARWRMVFGLFLVVVAGGLVMAALAAKGTTGAMFAVLFSAIIAVAALFGVLGPVVVPAISMLFGSVAAKVGGANWKLAAAEVRRVPHRSASVAMPLVLAAAMVTFFAVTVGTVRNLESELSQGSRPDVQISDVGERPLTDEVDRVANRPEVAGSAVLHRAEGKRADGDTYVALGADPQRLATWLNAENEGATGLADLREGTALMSEGAMWSWGTSVGQAVTLDGLPGGARTVKVVGTVPSGLLSYEGVVVADPSIGPASSVVVALKPGADVGAYRAAVLAGLAAEPTVAVSTSASDSAENQHYLDLAIVMLMVLLGLSVAVAVTGIGTTLTISVQERRKELALRRALGVTKGGLQHGVVAEAVLLALVGVLGGGLLGLGYAQLTIAAVGVSTFPSADWLSLGLGGLAVVVLAVLSAFGPARGASRIRPAAGLASG